MNMLRQPSMIAAFALVCFLWTAESSAQNNGTAPGAPSIPRSVRNGWEATNPIPLPRLFPSPVRENTKIAQGRGPQEAVFASWGGE